MKTVAQESAVRPSTHSTMRPAALAQRGPSRTETLARAGAPIDSVDPIDSILIEANASLELVLDALWTELDAAPKGSRLGSVFNVLDAVKARLDVARELHHEARDDDQGPASTNRPRCSAEAGLEESGLSPVNEDPFQESVDVIEGSLWNMRDYTRKLVAMATGDATNGDALVRHMHEAEDTYREAAAALKVLTRLEIERSAQAPGGARDLARPRWSAGVRGTIGSAEHAEHEDIELRGETVDDESARGAGRFWGAVASGARAGSPLSSAPQPPVDTPIGVQPVRGVERVVALERLPLQLERCARLLG